MDKKKIEALVKELAKDVKSEKDLSALTSEKEILILSPSKLSLIPR